MNKRPKLSLTLAGLICLTVIFVVNAFTLKVDSYLTIAIVAIIAWLLGIPVGLLWKKRS